jgi:hypothetical protein
MAALNFPNNPEDGQLYPDPAEPGVTQYVWNATKGTWLAVAKGVERVDAATPIIVGGTASVPVVGIVDATPTRAGAMTAAQAAKLAALPDPGTPSPNPPRWYTIDSPAAQFNGRQLSFPITSNGAAITPVSEEAMMIALNGVVLEPGVGFNLVQDNMVFSTAPRAGTTFSGAALVI